MRCLLKNPHVLLATKPCQRCCAKYHTTTQRHTLARQGTPVPCRQQHHRRVCQQARRYSIRRDERPDTASHEPRPEKPHHGHSLPLSWREERSRRLALTEEPSLQERVAARCEHLPMGTEAKHVRSGNGRPLRQPVQSSATTLLLTSLRPERPTGQFISRDVAPRRGTVRLPTNQHPQIGSSTHQRAATTSPLSDRTGSANSDVVSLAQTSSSTTLEATNYFSRTGIKNIQTPCRPVWECG